MKHVANLLVFQFETDFGKASQVIFWDPAMKISDKWRITHDLPTFDYFPKDETTFTKPKAPKSRKTEKPDFSVLYSDKYSNVVDHFLAFLNQKYFRQYTIMSHNGSRQGNKPFS